MNILLVLAIIMAFFVMGMIIGFIKIFKFFIKFMTPIAVIVFNLTNWSIINYFITYLGHEKLQGSSSVAVDSAIVTVIFTILSNFINNPGRIEANIRNNQDLNEYRVPISGRNGRLYIDAQLTVKYKFIKDIINKFGGIQLLILNSTWTSIDINKEEEYNFIDSSNSSKEIIINLVDDNKLYLELNIVSDKTVKSNGIIKLEIRHKNKAMNSLLPIFFDIKCNSQKIVYRVKEY